MPILIAIVGAIGAVIFWTIRARNAADAGGEIVDMANDVRLAARRFGFRRKTGQHPVEDIEDSNMAIAAIAVSFLELDDYPSQEQRIAMMRSLQANLRIDLNATEEMTVLGRWFMNQCNGPDAAIDRIARKLSKLSGPASITPLMKILQDMLDASDAELNDRQREALAGIKRAFRI